MIGSHASIAWNDIKATMAKHSLVTMLGWQDVRQRYRRSALGPFWLTISMGVMIGSIGLVFGRIFGTPMSEFLPFLATGLIVWTFISSSVNEGSSAFVSAEGIIKQLPLPLFLHVLRMLWRNVIIAAHNVIIVPLVFLAVGKAPSLIIFLSIPGFLLLSVNLAWMALTVAILCTRYRDLPQIIASVLQVLFYLTPIMWMPSLMPARASGLLLNYNPLFHLIEIVRAPIIGQEPSLLNWMVAAVMAIIGWAIALIFYGRYRHRIAYWL
jgi:ABC-type polysaccharide/polyol phosphate export permease